MRTIRTYEAKLSVGPLRAIGLTGMFIGDGTLGAKLDVLESVGSTNAYVKQRALQGAPHGFAAVAARQSAGRGRFEREWYSPPNDGVYLSILLRPEMKLFEAPRLTLLAALAVCDMAVGLGIDARIKWPNDVLVNGKKLSGILLETGARHNALDYVVLGIGINVNTVAFPGALSGATSLALEKGHKLSRPRVAAAVIGGCEALLRVLEKEGFGAVLERYCERSCTLGQHITITEGSARRHGVAQGFDELGFLLLNTGGRTERISSGDVTLREET